MPKVVRKKRSRAVAGTTRTLRSRSTKVQVAKDDSDQQRSSDNRLGRHLNDRHDWYYSDDSTSPESQTIMVADSDQQRSSDNDGRAPSRTLEKTTRPAVLNNRFLQRDVVDQLPDEREMQGIAQSSSDD